MIAFGIFTSVLLGAALAFHFLKKQNRVVTIIWLLLGFGLAPVLGKWIGSLFQMAGGVAFGLVIPVALAVFVTVVLFFDIKERKNHKMIRWIALSAATLWIAAGPSVGVFNSLVNTGNGVMEQGNSSIHSTGR